MGRSRQCSFCLLYMVYGIMKFVYCTWYTVYGIMKSATMLGDIIVFVYTNDQVNVLFYHVYLFCFVLLNGLFAGTLNAIINIKMIFVLYI